MIWLWLACIGGAYIIGSIPFGVIIGRARGVDIRQHGSRNIGATNVARVLGKKAGLLCFALDLLKGAGPVVVAGVIGEMFGRSAIELSSANMWLWMAVAAAAMLGHVFSIFLGFKGGKGVATGFGAMVAVYPLLTLPALGAMVVWYTTLRLFKFVSLASIVAVVSLPLLALLTAIPPDALEHPLPYTVERVMHASPPVIVTLFIAALVIVRHRANIRRLIRGEEPRITDHKRPTP
jgi:glycerol-3-phosphate acyltransferase PlsY